ncbi:ABC transporter permease subunit [Mycoplasmopsis alligatoris]|uniref:ABC transporter, permease protein n=1 Tax=Mycoplasmopsis alligatoris A21JP2 TaxID=747682 RepID=D4XV49_9BACT|nr:ABC transporter permease subunit [Mycoplasmopsis alligatoris]EFF41768.1 ABC transporter, permease protein [Mycoplasmopsis alligatoris A21JP2]
MSKQIKEFLKYLLVIFLLLIFLFPLYYLFVKSHYSNSFETNNIVSFSPDTFDFYNYKQALNTNFLPALGLSISSLVLVLLIRLFIFILAAIALNKLPKVIVKFILIFLLIISLIPDVVLFLPLKKVLIETNLINKSLAFSLITNSIFSYFIFLNIFKTFEEIKEKQKETIQIDNIGFRHQVLYVYLPKLRMPLFLLVIFSTLNVWNDYLWPLFILSGYKLDTIGIWFRFLGDTGFSNLENVQSAGAIIALSIPLSIYLIFSPFINKIISKNS